jgi:acyl-coenzyme A thioesterase PaaI-like protein
MTILPSTVHRRCIVCSPVNGRGLAVSYRPSDDGRGVTAMFPCDPVFEGYAGQLHGGVVCSLLDGAMVHCLFQIGRAAYTAELSVRFHGAVITGTPALVRGRLERSRGRLHVVTAELSQGGVVRAVARATFLENPSRRPPRDTR